MLFKKPLNNCLNLMLKKANSNLASIFALTSGSNQRCAVAVFRISGTKCLKTIEGLTLQNCGNMEPRKMYLRDIYHPKSKEKIDKSLIVWFKAPNSFTGEDVCEFHLHGGPAVISSFFNCLSNIDGLRQAEPGEFSRRAFINGKMDLTEIEGLADLINAETEMQRKQALNQMEGSLSKLYSHWREDIIKALANVEAYIDFHEEENIEDDILEQVSTKLKSLKKSIESHLNDNRRGERLRNGIKLVIIGEPNAGKSSLLNLLCQRPAAIVSPIPGTTRDIIESALNIAGYPLVLSDTAGLRKSDDIIEREGVKRAKDRIDTADIVILVIDAKKYSKQIEEKGVKKFVKQHLKEILVDEDDHKESDYDADEIYKNSLRGKHVLVALNKCDLISKEVVSNNFDIPAGEYADDDAESVSVSVAKLSCLNQNNEIEELLNVLKNRLNSLYSNNLTEMPIITQQRHRDNLIKCIESIDNYLMVSSQKGDELDRDIVIACEDLRNAAKWLGKITGLVSTEHILDVIFRDFCIGK